MAWPKLSLDGTGSMVRSMSTRRGTTAFVNGDDEVDEVRHCNVSYTSSVIIRASYFRANWTSFWRVGRDIVFPDGLENVGTQ